MRRADLGDVHLQVRMLANKRAGCAGVVEMDVAEHEMLDLVERQPLVGEPCLEGGNRRGRSAVEERETVVGLEHVRRDDAVRALVVQFDRLECHAATTAETMTASEATNSSGSCSTDPSERAKTTSGVA